MVNLCDDVNESDITLFADDMTISCSSANIENLYLRMNLILDLFLRNGSPPTSSLLILIKLKNILFHITIKPVTDSLFCLYLNNVSLEKVASTRFLRYCN